VTLPKHEPRVFSLQRKASLFHVCQTCAMCRQRIEELDDAEVDHVEEYWRGGSPHDQYSHDPPARLQDPCNNDRVIVAFGE
jgi:hypothetical protein